MFGVGDVEEAVPAEAEEDLEVRPSSPEPSFSRTLTVKLLNRPIFFSLSLSLALTFLSRLSPESSILNF